ncbi:hypothetical protein J4448_05690 [Candidatus Woesearchaeota archaeon]|nr:hypothetical protein [Candidatus Woesearchaeota archaeon]
MVKRGTKKAQSMTINVIVVAALALIVLVVLVSIFSGRVRIFSQSLQDCGAKQGVCKEKCETNEALIKNTNCEEDKSSNKKSCCVQVFNQ